MDTKRIAVAVGAFAVLAVAGGSSVASGQAQPPAPASQPVPAAPSVPPVPSTVSTDLGEQVLLAAGQEAKLAQKDLTVRFTRLVSDSRCRPGVQCIWAGDAVVAVTVQEPGRGEGTEIQLHTGLGPAKKSAEYAACRIDLVSVTRDGKQAVLKVSKA